MRFLTVTNHENPQYYYLIDYAGYNAVEPIQAVQEIPDEETGHTTLGLPTGKERNSPFYAPERGAGVEKEIADTAIIIDKEDHFLIAFIWKSIVMEELSEDGAELEASLSEEFITNVFDEAEVIEIESESGADTEVDRLYKGDRLQLREYIFDIEEMRKTSDARFAGQLVYRCNAISWKIYHGRIVIKNTDRFPEATFLSIPQIIELRQWSVATDVYGIGTLFLYSVYNMGIIEGAKDDVPSETKYHRLVNELSNPHFYETMWLEIDEICGGLYSCFDKRIPDAALAEMRFEPRSGIEQVQEPRNLIEYTKDLAKIIYHSVPDTRIILRNLEGNAAYFLFAIHFTMCCLHRRTSTNAQDGIQYPFCESRLVTDDSGATAKMMKEYIHRFSLIVGTRGFHDFVIQDDEADSITPLIESTAVLRWRNYELSRRSEELTKEKQALIEKYNQLLSESRKLSEVAEQG